MAPKKFAGALLFLFPMTSFSIVPLKAHASLTVASCQTTSDGGAYAWVEVTGDSFAIQEEFYGKMIHPYGPDSYAQAAAYWNGAWAFGPVVNLTTGQSWDSGLINQDNSKDVMITWDGAYPQTSGVNYAYASVTDMAPDPSCSGPQSPTP